MPVHQNQNPSPYIQLITLAGVQAGLAMVAFPRSEMCSINHPEFKEQPLQNSLFRASGVAAALSMLDLSSGEAA